MGGLAHYLEDEGLPTTQISLIRPHTETIKPPRALWVPFELGRPLGPPGQDEFQTRVLVAALKLLEAESGPVLEDFPEDAPVDAAADAPAPLACPVSFPAFHTDQSLAEQKRETLRTEMEQLRSWYDIAVSKWGRTTVGVSGLDLDPLADFICAFMEPSPPPSYRPDLPLDQALRLAVNDLKAFYTEALTAQPGQSASDSSRIADWFWGDTTAGKLLVEVKTICEQSDDPGLRFVGRVNLVPRLQAVGKADRENS